MSHTIGNHDLMIVVDVPASSMSNSTADRIPFGEIWWRQGCPGHSNMAANMRTQDFHRNLKSIAKDTVQEHPILSLVLDWADTHNKKCKGRKLPCTCAGRASSSTEGLQFYIPSWS